MRNEPRLVTLTSLVSETERPADVLDSIARALSDLGLPWPIALLDGKVTIGRARLAALYDLFIFNSDPPAGVGKMGQAWLIPVVDIHDLTATELEHNVLCDLRLLHYGAQLAKADR